MKKYGKKLNKGVIKEGLAFIGLVAPWIIGLISEIYYIIMRISINGFNLITLINILCALFIYTCVYFTIDYFNGKV